MIVTRNRFHAACMHVALACGVLSAPLIVPAESLVLVRPHGESTPYDSDLGYGNFSKSITEQFVASGIRFNISYDDTGVGFDDPIDGAVLRARFENVLSYVARVINYPGRTLDVHLDRSEFDGTGALATAGTFYPASAGIHPGSTLQRLQSGFKPFIGFPEIAVTVDLGFDWNVGVGQPGPGEADFFSVLLHEITHGLGFTSVMESDGSSALGNGVYTTFDALLFDGALFRRVISDTTPPFFSGDGVSLTGGVLDFDGAKALSAYGRSVRAPVFSPNPFQPGSSLSHWDESRLVGGAAMTHAITLGTTQRQYASVEIGALMDLGYDKINTGGSGGVQASGCMLEASSAAARAGAGNILILGLAVVALCRRPER